MTAATAGAWGTPRLDVPPRHDHENRIIVVSSRSLLLVARRVQLRTPDRRRTGVRVRYDNQVGALPSANGAQFRRIPFSNPLLARLATAGKGKCTDVRTAEVAVLQEPAHERIRLQAFTEEGDADSAHSLSQPRATVSDSEIPSTVRSGLLLTRTGPFPSR